MLTPIYLDMRDITIKVGAKIKIFKILCTKYMASSEAMTSSTHSFAYSYGLVKKCFLKICETSKFHNFLIFQPIFIRFSLFCSENFTLSSEIKLDQLRTSPLKTLRSSPVFDPRCAVASRTGSVAASQTGPSPSAPPSSGWKWSGPCAPRTARRCAEAPSAAQSRSGAV